MYISNKKKLHLTQIVHPALPIKIINCIYCIYCIYVGLLLFITSNYDSNTRLRTQEKKPHGKLTSKNQFLLYQYISTHGSRQARFNDLLNCPDPFYHGKKFMDTSVCLRTYKKRAELRTNGPKFF